MAVTRPAIQPQAARRSVSLPVERPEFGDGIGHEPRALGPRELFCGLFVDPDEHLHYLEPAFGWLEGALENTPLPALSAGTRAAALIEELLAWARGTSSAPPLQHSAPSWPARVAREFAPAGLSDGAWLRGALRGRGLDTELGLGLLRQFRIRVGDPTRGEGYSERYAALLESIGVPPASITRWEWDETAPCADISYEHALLGLLLGLFPAAFLNEAVGFNLWMSTLGPAPLLERVAGDLGAGGAQLRYLHRLDRAALDVYARESAQLVLLEPDADRSARVARGFAAAHLSYLAWEQAMLGPNVPFTAWDSVLEMLRRKARFAADHHQGVRLGKRNVEDLLREGGKAHEWLLERLAASPLIRPGDPDGSRFMAYSLSIDGPMFDAFTPREKLDLRAWITALGTRDDVRTATPSVPLQGRYAPAQDRESLEAFATRRYASLSEPELHDCLLRSDQHPALPAFTRPLAERVVRAIEAALTTDPCLLTEPPRPYTEQAPAALTARLRAPLPAPRKDAGAEPIAAPRHDASLALDGSWLQASSDVRRAGFDDQRWLFRTYAAKYGGGALPVAACGAARRGAAELLCDVLLGRLEPSSSQHLSPLRLASCGLVLGSNSQRFLPELLGVNLAAACLGAAAMRSAAEARTGAGGPVADGIHCALAAVQAFMRRVQDAAPTAVERQWERIWRASRVLEILARGSQAQQRVLLEAAVGAAR
jgi:hypothetical protein